VKFLRGGDVDGGGIDQEGAGIGVCQHPVLCQVHGHETAHVPQTNPTNYCHGISSFALSPAEERPQGL
jgi:hypothetical protein